ncbi:Hypothetical predicted protein [Mytilus galloprovincialis]|uniref:Uncharacterized protein n=1 Tax=Mytilus galloprovincialis TaxID=29158 RepID=A0A8B6HFX7_MYTGA|nr:Hypothetical predicted protein [Mytilus galloprovincialis]
MSDVSNEDDSAENDQDETWTPPSVISENETKQLEATNNELKKKVQNLEATYAEEGQAKYEAERRTEIAEKKMEDLQDRLKKETKEKCLLSKKVIEQEREYDAIIKKLVLELNETKTELLNVPDKYQELQRELSKDLCEQRSEYDIELRKVKTEAVER